MPLNTQDRIDLKNIRSLTSSDLFLLEKKVEEELASLSLYKMLYGMKIKDKKGLKEEVAKKLEEFTQYYGDIIHVTLEESDLIDNLHALKLEKLSRAKSHLETNEIKTTSEKKALNNDLLAAATKPPSPQKKQPSHSRFKRTYSDKISKDTFGKMNRLLLTNEQIKKVNHYFLKNPRAVKLRRSLKRKGAAKVQKLSKIEKALNLSFSVIRADNGKLYALYFGKENLLGKGGLGKVKLGQDLETGDWVAVKVQKNIAIDYSEWQKITREESVISQMRKQEIAAAHRRTNEWWRRKKEGKVYSVQPILTGKNVFNLTHTPLAFEDKLDLVIAILEELKNIHDDRILHLDIKPENMFYDPNTKKATIIDFGASLRLKSGQGYHPDKFIRGTKEYFNRKIRRGPKPKKDQPQMLMYSKSVDIFAAGFTLLDIFTNYKRFSLKNAFGTLDSTFTLPNRVLEKTNEDENHPIDKLLSNASIPENFKKGIKEILEEMTDTSHYNQNNMAAHIDKLQILRDQYQEEQNKEKEKKLKESPVQKTPSESTEPPKPDKPKF